MDPGFRQRLDQIIRLINASDGSLDNFLVDAANRFGNIVSTTFDKIPGTWLAYSSELLQLHIFMLLDETSKLARNDSENYDFVKRVHETLLRVFKDLESKDFTAKTLNTLVEKETNSYQSVKHTIQKYDPFIYANGILVRLSPYDKIYENARDLYNRIVSGADVKEELENLDKKVYTITFNAEKSADVLDGFDETDYDSLDAILTISALDKLNESNIDTPSFSRLVKKYKEIKARIEEIRDKINEANYPGLYNLVSSMDEMKKYMEAKPEAAPQPKEEAVSVPIASPIPVPEPNVEPEISNYCDALTKSLQATVETIKKAESDAVKWVATAEFFNTFAEDKILNIESLDIKEIEKAVEEILKDAREIQNNPDNHDALVNEFRKKYASRFKHSKLLSNVKNLVYGIISCESDKINNRTQSEQLRKDHDNLQEQLRKCLSSREEKVKEYEEATEAEKPGIVEGIATVNMQIAALEKQLQEKQKQLDECVTNSADQQTELVKLQRENEALRAESGSFKDMQETIDALRKTIEEQENTIAEQKKFIDSAQERKSREELAESKPADPPKYLEQCRELGISILRAARSDENKLDSIVGAVNAYLERVGQPTLNRDQLAADALKYQEKLAELRSDQLDLDKCLNNLEGERLQNQRLANLIVPIFREIDYDAKTWEEAYEGLKQVLLHIQNYKAPNDLSGDLENYITENVDTNKRERTEKIIGIINDYVKSVHGVDNYLELSCDNTFMEELGENPYVNLQFDPVNIFTQIDRNLEALKSDPNALTMFYVQMANMLLDPAIRQLIINVAQSNMNGYMTGGTRSTSNSLKQAFDMVMYPAVLDRFAYHPKYSSYLI